MQRNIRILRPVRHYAVGQRFSRSFYSLAGYSTVPGREDCIDPEELSPFDACEEIATIDHIGPTPFPPTATFSDGGQAVWDQKIADRFPKFVEAFFTRA